MLEQYYIKKGRKYIPVDRFTGWPADGVWLIKRTNYGRSQQLMIQLEDDLLKAASVAEITLRTVLKDKIQDAVAEAYDEIKDTYSIKEMAELVTKKLLREKEEKIDHERIIDGY